MSTFDRFRKSTGDFFGGEKKDITDEITDDNLDDDNEFSVNVQVEAEERVIIEDAVETPYEVGRMNITRIGEDTIITGDIETKGHIDILGTVKGNIAAEGNVALRSDIKGNVKGNNIGLGACNIMGDIEAVRNILTDSDSEINGNVKGSEISIAGHVTGDVKALSMIVFKKEAVMEGDINTDGLVVEPGAILNGKISITRKPNKVAAAANEYIQEPVVEPQRTAPPPPVEKEEVLDVEDEDITDI